MSKKLKIHAIKTFKSYGDKIVLKKGKLEYSGNKISEEISNGTPLGFSMLKTVTNLSINLLSREKVKFGWKSIELFDMPTTSKEFLVRNDRQGGTMNLIYWNAFSHKYYTKGKPIDYVENFVTHWMEIPER